MAWDDLPSNWEPVPIGRGIPIPETKPEPPQGVDWICNGADWRSGRHAGYSKTGLPARCPYCGASVRVRTHCACGHPIKECSQSICTSPLARDD